MIAVVASAIEAAFVLWVGAELHQILRPEWLLLLIVPILALAAGLYALFSGTEGDGSCLLLAVFWLVLGTNLIIFLWFVFSHSGGV